MNAENGKKIGVKVRKQNFRNTFCTKNWNQDLWERKKNTKIPGQKFLETNIGVKNLNQKKIREKYKEKS